MNELIEAATAVVDRWDSTDWKAASTADVMNRLRNALSAQPQVCCGEYATCLRACTPRGKWLQAQESAIPGGGGTVSARETLGNCGCMGSNATTTGGSGGGMLSPTDRAVPFC